MRGFHSPKRCVEAAVARVRPGGDLVVGVPNAANAMKRLRVLAGRTNYGSAQSFYHHGSPYTGHVREWTAGELHQLAGWLGLDDVAVVGRNWLGHQRFPRIPEALRSILDRGLQARPGPCSDLYLVASTQFGGHGASRLPNDHGGE